jgi:hypothetical protein
VKLPVLDSLGGANEMTEPTRGVQLTDEDVTVVIEAIREGRVRTLDGAPYDPKVWDEETVRDWLQRTHLPPHARYIVTTLRRGLKIQCRPVAPTAYVALRALEQSISQLEREVAELRERLPRDSSES